MNQPNSIDVSQTRANEILKGKAGAVIMDLVTENATLSAACEAFQNRLVQTEMELAKARHRIGELMEAGSNEPAPASSPPQSFDDTATVDS